MGVRKVLEEGSLGGQRTENLRVQGLQEEVSFLCVKSGKGQVAAGTFQVVGQGVLGRSKSTEGDILVYFAQLPGQVLRGQAVAGFPAGNMVGFGKGVTDKCPLTQHGALT